MDGSWQYMLIKISQKKLRTIWLHAYVGYKTECNKWTNPRQINNQGSEEGGWQEVLKGEGAKCMVTEDLTLGGRHTMQYTYDAL